MKQEYFLLVIVFGDLILLQDGLTVVVALQHRVIEDVALVGALVLIFFGSSMVLLLEFQHF